MQKGYIRGLKLSRDPKREDTFFFTANPNSAFYWQSREQAESECRMFDGYRIKIPSALGGTYICNKFKVEERKPGEFVIFCEAPFKIENTNK